MKEEKINVEEHTEEAVAQEENVETTDVESPAQESEKTLEQALEEIEQLKTQMLYKTAEFDNYRKRTLKEKAELILNGGEKAVTAILPVVDDMERAIDNGAKTDDPAVLREGMELIYNKLMKGQSLPKCRNTDSDISATVSECGLRARQACPASDNELYSKFRRRKYGPRSLEHGLKTSCQGMLSGRFPVCRRPPKRRASISP